MIIDSMITGKTFTEACLSAGYSRSYTNTTAHNTIKGNAVFCRALDEALAKHKEENRDNTEDVRERIRLGLDACLDGKGGIHKGMLTAYFTGLNLLGKTYAAFIEKTEVTQEILEKKELTEIERAEGQRLAMIRLKDVS
jgi:phage terminase small subunit